MHGAGAQGRAPGPARPCAPLGLEPPRGEGVHRGGEGLGPPERGVEPPEPGDAERQALEAAQELAELLGGAAQGGLGREAVPQHAPRLRAAPPPGPGGQQRRAQAAHGGPREVPRQGGLRGPRDQAPQGALGRGRVPRHGLGDAPVAEAAELGQVAPELPEEPAPPAVRAVGPDVGGRREVLRVDDDPHAHRAAPRGGARRPPRQGAHEGGPRPERQPQNLLDPQLLQLRPGAVGRAARGRPGAVLSEVRQPHLEGEVEGGAEAQAAHEERVEGRVQGGPPAGKPPPRAQHGREAPRGAAGRVGQPPQGGRARAGEHVGAPGRVEQDEAPGELPAEAVEQMVCGRGAIAGTPRGLHPPALGEGRGGQPLQGAPGDVQGGGPRRARQQRVGAQGVGRERGELEAPQSARRGAHELRVRPHLEQRGGGAQEGPGGGQVVGEVLLERVLEQGVRVVGRRGSRRRCFAGGTGLRPVRESLGGGGDVPQVAAVGAQLGRGEVVGGDAGAQDDPDPLALREAAPELQAGLAGVPPGPEDDAGDAADGLQELRVAPEAPPEGVQVEPALQEVAVVEEVPGLQEARGQADGHVHGVERPLTSEGHGRPAGPRADDPGAGGGRERREGGGGGAPKSVGRPRRPREVAAVFPDSPRGQGPQPRLQPRHQRRDGSWGRGLPGRRRFGGGGRMAPPILSRLRPANPSP